MKGSPLLRALIAFALIAMAGLPLWKLTSLDGAVVAPALADPAASEVGLRLTFSNVPKKFEVLHLGKVVWTEAPNGSELTRSVALVYPKEGVDLLVKVVWASDAGEGAVRVRLKDPDGNEHDKTAWGRGEMEEVITFP